MTSSANCKCACSRLVAYIIDGPMRAFSGIKSRLERATRALYVQYGTPNSYATNVVYTNGLLDPWQDSGITGDVVAGSYVVNIQRKPHQRLCVTFCCCANNCVLHTESGRLNEMRSIADETLVEVKEAKKLIVQLITEWTEPIKSAKPDVKASKG